MVITINTGESRNYDGVTYTATSDAVLNLDDAGKVSGIASGSVVAKLTDKDSSPQITFDGATPFDLSCIDYSSAFDVDTIQVKAHGTTINYTSGQINYKADGVSGAGEVSIAGMIANLLPFNVALNIPDAGMKIAFGDNNINTFSASEKVNATLTFPESLTVLLDNVKGLLGPLLKVDEDTVNKIYDLALKLVTSPTIAQLEGEVSWNKDEKKLGITKDSNLALNILDYSLSLAAENGNVDGLSFFFKLTGEDVALGARFTPSTDENASLHLKAAENNSQIYDGLINVTSGAVDLDIINAKISVEKDTAFTISQGDYLAKFALNNAASLTFSADAQDILYYKTDEGNGSLDFMLYNGDKECFSGNVETNGSFTLDTENKIIGVTKGTTTKISIGDYVLTTSANENSTTDIAFKNDGISFTPHDGGSFNMLLKQGDTTFFDGALKITGGSGSFNPTTQKFSFTEGSEVSITLNGSTMQYDFKVVGGDASLKVEAQSDGKFIITPDNGDGSLDFVVKQNDTSSSNSNIVENFTATTAEDTAKSFYGNISVSNGSIIVDEKGQKIGLTAGTTLSLTQDGQTITLTTPKDISATYKVEEDIYYLMLDDSVTANVSITRDGQSVVSGEMEMGGVFSYSPKTGTYGLTGANSSHGDGTNTFLQFTIDGQKTTSRVETNDTTIVFIPNLSDGKLEINFPNERKHAMKLTLTRDGQTIFENNIAIDGVVSSDISAQEITLNKNTVLTLTQDENEMTITALEDAGGQLTFIDGGIRFAPNAGDGALELNFVTSGRKANLNVTGAIILGEDGKLSLEDGTEVNLDWEDGTNLKMTSHGSTGSIGFSEKGLQITSDDENLDIDLTTAAGVQTNLSGIKGTIYYNAGTVSFEENSKITATTTLGGQPVLMTLETIGGTGHISFADNGVIYSADTGAMRITWSRDDLESTFTVNSGTIQIGHGLFKLAEGTDLATDLKNFVPALYFTTSDAGTYIINRR